MPRHGHEQPRLVSADPLVVSTAAVPSPRLGLLAALLFSIHAGYHALDGHPEHALWACHLGTLLVAAGFAFAWPTANGMGFLWLGMGNVLWLIDLANGAALLPTSLCTHVGGFGLSVLGLVRLGMPRGTWWKAVVGFVALQQICRWITPGVENVNISSAVWVGWEERFPSYLLFAVVLEALGAAVYYATEKLVRRALASAAPPKPDGVPASTAVSR